MKKITILLTIALLASFNLFAQTEPIDTDGDGYRNVSILDHLRWISENNDAWSLNYELDNDINAAETEEWNNGNGWSPIGVSFQNSYSGNFNGNGYLIDSLFINRPNQGYIALFGITLEANISNLAVVNCNIIGNGIVGSLVGDNYSSSTISNCYSTGIVLGDYSVGGLVGYSYSSYIRNCYSAVNVTGKSETGGLVGGNGNYSTISNCYSTGNVLSENSVGGLVGNNIKYSIISNCFSTSRVSGNKSVGGLVGCNDNSTIINNYSAGNVLGLEIVGGLVGTIEDYSTVLNSYSTSIVVGEENVGGLVGYNKSSTIINSYSTGAVSGERFIGGLVGNKSYTTKVVSCFWDIQTSKLSNSAGGIGKTTAEMQTKDTFTDFGWNFDFIWDIDEGYPFININTKNSPSDKNSNGYLEISTLKDLRWLSESGLNLDSNWELNNNIDASDTKHWYQSLGFFPISIFIGEFNGNGYKIENLYINRQNKSHIGLFGIVVDAEIRNLGLVNCDIKGDNMFTGGIVGETSSSVFKNSFYSGIVIGDLFVGGLVGYNNNESIIIESYNIGSISGVDNVGGLVGYNDNKSIIIESYNTGSMSGEDNVGGLVGTNSSSINNCFSSGGVSGEDNVGGLVGTNSSSINNCFSRGSVSGEEYIGGLVGANSSSRTYNSYSTGNVSGNGEYVGGLVGDSFSKLKSTFWDVQTSGQSKSNAGIGKFTSEMKTESTFKNAGWDFDTTWSIKNDLNDGYPYLQELSSSLTSIKTNLDEESNFYIYPNPSEGIVQVKFDIEHTSELSIKVIDNNGNEIHRKKINNSDLSNALYEFDLSEFPAGVYHVILTNSKGISSKKVLIVR